MIFYHFISQKLKLSDDYIYIEKNYLIFYLITKSLKSIKYTLFHIYNYIYIFVSPTFITLLKPNSHLILI